MPDTISHYLFGLDTTKAITNLSLYKVIKNHRNLFFIGCQGPDPMYYHAPFKQANYAHVASLMHTQHTGYFLTSALCFAKKQMDDEDAYASCIAYLCGMICHYALDVCTHPYIFYLSGLYVPDDPSTHQYKGLHKKIEIAIDALLLEEQFNKKAHHFKVHKHILKPLELPNSVLALYDELLFSIYAIPNGGHIFKESYKDFRQYYQLTYDTLGIKKHLTASVKPLLPPRISDFANSFFYHNCVDEATDYLNGSKKVWLHPVTGNVHIQSFKDLLKNAHKFAFYLLSNADDFLLSRISLEELEQAFPNLSYVTGLSTSDTRPLKYFKP